MFQLVRSSIAFLLDLFWIVLSALILWIIFSGGGRYTWFGYAVRIQSVANPLVAWHLIPLLRLWLLRSAPFLAVKRWRIDELDSRIVAWFGEANAQLSAVGLREARFAVTALIVLITVVKLANAAFYPGFFSGDDVEIHEMTFAKLFAWDWRAWNLRNALYPITVIYPVQALLVWAGISDTGTLVFAGRAVVALLSSLTIWLVYRIGLGMESVGTGVVAAVVFGIHRLHVTFGGSELPRPVASVFIVAAFLCLLSRNRSSAQAALAGVLLAIGGAFRFGELVFIVPAVAMCIWSGARRDALIIVSSFGLSVALVIGAADLVYWGSPFYSLRNVLQYTLIDRLSSRGYEPPFFYLTALLSWTSLPIALLAAVGAPKSWRLTMWWVLPLIAFSALPHKEPRYLIAVLPFVCLSAAIGLQRVLRALQRDPLNGNARTMATFIAVLGMGGLLLEIGGWRFRKPTAPLDLAHFVSQRGCAGGVAVEQLWSVGGRLYLRDCGQLVDVDRARLQQPDDVRRLVESGIEWILLRQPVRADERSALEAANAQEVLTAPDAGYVVMRVTARRR